jgi:hypothetical protein
MGLVCLCDKQSQPYCSLSEEKVNKLGGNSSIKLFFFLFGRNPVIFNNNPINI